jgi:uncharacterized membrane protein YfcA
MKELEAYTASVVIGLCLGLIGAGGSILTIPVFVYILKTSPVASTIYSMFVVGICSFTGAIIAFTKKLVDIKAAVVFGLPSVAGVFIARKLIFPLVPEQLFSIGSMAITKDVFIMLVLAIIMLIVSIKMLKKKSANVTVRNAERKNTNAIFFLQGICTGIVTGLLGVGGGFLIVPALLLWLKLPVKTAIGTTLFIITINSAAGFITSYTSVLIQWPLMIKFAIGAIAGILAGSKLSEKIKADYLKKILAWFIIITSVYVLYKQFQRSDSSGMQ